MYCVCICVNVCLCIFPSFGRWSLYSTMYSKSPFSLQFSPFFHVLFWPHQRSLLFVRYIRKFGLLRVYIRRKPGALKFNEKTRQNRFCILLIKNLCHSTYENRQQIFAWRIFVKLVSLSECRYSTLFQQNQLLHSIIQLQNMEEPVKRFCHCSVKQLTEFV